MSMSGAHTQAKHGDPHIHIIHNLYWFNGNKEGNNWSPSSVQLFSWAIKQERKKGKCCLPC